jgi:hypothetical protein
MNSPTSIQRLLLAAGLALATLTPAAFAGESSSAQAAPISPLKVQATGTEATITFTTAEPAYITNIHKPVNAPAAANPTPATGRPTPAQIVDAQFFGVRTYATAHELKLAGLKSNTTYDATITAETKAGQKHTASTRFTTSKQRVRVTLREINITADGDSFVKGDGEPTWYLRLLWKGGSAGGCFPTTCNPRSYGEGRIFPRNPQGQFLSWTFAEENFDTMPTAFTIMAGGTEDDLPGSIDIDWGEAFECVFGDTCAPPNSELSFSYEGWQVPVGRDVASTPVTVNTDNLGKGFRSTMAFTFELFHDNLSYPSARNRPQSTWAR